MRRRKSITVRRIRRNIFSVLETSKREPAEEMVLENNVDWKKQLSKIRAERYDCGLVCVRVRCGVYVCE
jgi:alpha-D-ribose 1-methylphosphonate 5-triphosphate synthase subunit PhnG